jgi:predicted  nucleic acid-binding Zn-ribbon protein
VPDVPDDERTRRRLGDATKSRIDDLASGWSTDESGTGPEPVELTPEPEPVMPPPRAKRKTEPPPPPGSKARVQLENAILDSVDTPSPAKRDPIAKGLDDLFGPESKRPTPPAEAARAKPPTAPPPIPPRAKATTKPPPVPPAKSGIKSGPTETGTVSVLGAIGGSGATPLPDKANIASAKPLRDDATDIDPGEHHPVPRGEFEAGAATESTDKDKARLRVAYEQSTIKRDAASALLGLPEQPETVVKPQPVEVLLHETAEVIRADRAAVNDTSSPTTPFERGDPTSLGDPTIAQINVAAATAGTLRAQAALRRKRGLLGDVRYVLTVMFGVRKARQEMTALDAKQEIRQQARRRNLITLGRAAATLDGFDHPALGPAREALVSVEDERSQHIAAVTAADNELMRVRRDREAKAAEHTEGSKAIEEELAEIANKLDPLEKSIAGIAKRADDLKEQLRKIDSKIANTEMSQHSVAGAHNRAAIQAEIATLKADRVAVARDEPKLAGELDALNPRVAALEGRRAELKKKRSDIETAESEDRRRCEELLTAIGAKRKVVDRAASDAEQLRDKILFELGERLYIDRPADLGPQVSPIDVIDVELGTGDRRAMELKEIISSVDTAKLARGIGVLVLIAAIGITITLFATGVV